MFPGDLGSWWKHHQECRARRWWCSRPQAQCSDCCRYSWEPLHQHVILGRRFTVHLHSCEGHQQQSDMQIKPDSCRLPWGGPFKQLSSPSSDISNIYETALTDFWHSCVGGSLRGFYLLSVFLSSWKESVALLGNASQREADVLSSSSPIW